MDLQKDLTYQIHANQKLLISGGNGSGKSTLLQVLSGFITPNEGTVVYKLGDKNIAIDKIKDHISFASPYLQLVEDLTLEELVNHIKIYKPFINKFSSAEVIDQLELAPAKKINTSNNSQAG